MMAQETAGKVNSPPPGLAQPERRGAAGRKAAAESRKVNPQSNIALQQERFCKAYAGVSFAGKGRGNGAQSAILAGYSEHTAAQSASRVLRNPAVRERIDYLTLQVAERILAETPESEQDNPQFPFSILHDVAKNGRNETARVRAAELLGKQKHGYWQDKLVIDLQAMPDTDLLAAVGRLLPGEGAMFAALLRRSRGEVIEHEVTQALPKPDGE